MKKRNHHAALPGAKFRKLIFRRQPMTKRRILQFIKAFSDLSVWFESNKDKEGVKFR